MLRARLLLSLSWRAQDWTWGQQKAGAEVISFGLWRRWVQSAPAVAGVGHQVAALSILNLAPGHQLHQAPQKGLESPR